MQNRDPIKVAVYTVITFGLYALYWFMKTRDEVNENISPSTTKVPSMWWFIVPLGSYWWVWLYSDALEDTTKGAIKRNDTFLLYAVTTMAIGFSAQLDVGDIFGFNGIVAVVIAIMTLFTMVVFSIFPYVMQTKFNKLPKSK